MRNPPDDSIAAMTIHMNDQLQQSVFDAAGVALAIYKKLREEKLPKKIAAQISIQSQKAYLDTSYATFFKKYLDEE